MVPLVKIGDAKRILLPTLIDSINDALSLFEGDVYPLLTFTCVLTQFATP